ncbi:pPIWI_RE_Z domain-containing protein [Fibrella forsythiae]|uniref:pPIWI-RE three-gene island domain-containing protein n=1 Tax=Fibrella forsythiae TaxID=2817061 RepID=A0ABS3JJH5_9BACT|nr:hypothetical protein [Fibrella forsythiae]MBO0950148.1 hypothetical protein [Fibrella forsythiae]
MNLTQRPRPNATYPAALADSPVAAPRLRASLSARQLFDVELGLVLLSQLMPTASPDHLPALLNDDTLAHNGGWTAKQRRCLNRGRDLLRPFQQSTLWNDLLDRYSRLTDQMQAFDISNDRSHFNQKSVGFFRNRVFTLRQLLA